MLREHKLRVLNDTSLFDSMQLHLRSILTVGMRCWAQWAADHLYCFPTLIKEHGAGFVIVGAHVEYEQPFTFFTADAFDVVGHAEVARDGQLLLGHMKFMNGTERFVSFSMISRPVSMIGDGSFAAFPSRLQRPLIDRFEPEEITNRHVPRETPRILEQLGQSPIIAEAVMPIRLFRHDCEAADQWSYIEIGAHAATARESLVLNAAKNVKNELQPALSKPTRFVDIEIRRPLFLFDEVQVHTRVFKQPDGLAFVHVYQSQMGGTHEHATVIERIGA